MKRIALALFLAFAGSVALAQFIGEELFRTKPSGAYVGPGDAVSGATFFYGLRGYNAAYATGSNAAVNIRRASDNHQCDLLITTAGGIGNTANCGTGGDNGQSDASFCTSTTCWVTEAYDQTGNGWHVVQTTAVNQPQYVMSCIASLPCMTFISASSTNLLSTTLLLTVNQPNTLVGVGDRTSGTGYQTILASGDGNNQLAFGNAANTVLVYGGTTVPANATASDNAWHSFIGPLNGASSLIYVDAVSTSQNTGTFAFQPDATDGIYVGSAGAGQFVDGHIVETSLYPSGLSSGNATTLCHNQFVYWGTSTSC